MLRSCPNRLEFKNECYSTVNQQKTSIFELILWEEQKPLGKTTGARSYIFTSPGMY
jgi:hypothetical protein